MCIIAVYSYFLKLNCHVALTAKVHAVNFPTLPSTIRRFFAWKCRMAASVLASYMTCVPSVPTCKPASINVACTASTSFNLLGPVPAIRNADRLVRRFFANQSSMDDAVCQRHVRRRLSSVTRVSKISAAGRCGHLQADVDICKYAFSLAGTGPSFVCALKGSLFDRPLVYSLFYNIMWPRIWLL